MKKLFFLFFTIGLMFGFDNVNAQILDDGIYEIGSALNDEMGISLASESTVNGINVQLETLNGKNEEKWIVKHISDDYYVISSANDENQVLDVAGALKEKGTNVALWRNKDGDNQKWLIKDAGDGYYNIVSKDSELYLDVYGAQASSGSNVQIWVDNGGDNQKWFFNKTEINTSTIDDGVYMISSAQDNNIFLTANGEAVNGTNVNVLENNYLLNQKWVIKYLGNGYYTLNSYINENITLDIYKASLEKGTNVEFWTNKNGDNQKWLIKDVGDGYYSIVSKLNGFYIDIHGGVAKSGTNVVMWPGNDGSNQKWKFTKVNVNSKSIDSGNYYISSVLDGSKVISAKTSSSGSNIVNGVSYNNELQKWQVTYLDNGYYILSLSSDNSKVMDLNNSNKAKGANVGLLNKNNGDNQQWIISESGDGYYYIISKCSKLSLDIYRASTADGVNIQTWSENGGNNQKFRFIEAETNGSNIEDGLYTMKSYLDDSKVIGLDLEMAINKAKLQMETFADFDSQKWYINSLGNGYYKITSALSGGKVIDSPNFSFTSGDNVILYTSKNTANQQWIIKDVGDGYYNIVTSYNLMKLGISGGSATENAKIILADGENNSQKFKLEKTTLTGGEQVITDGYYTLASSLNSNNVLDVYKALKTNATNVEVYKSNGGNNQIWYFKYLNNGYYKITSAMNPYISLDVHGNGNTNGTNVEVYKANNGENQQWAIRDAGDGKYILISKANGLSLHVDSSTSGANVYMYMSNNSNNQKFIFTRITKTKKYTGIDVSSHQGTIDWGKVANTAVGFAIIRAGYGGNWTSQDDSQLTNNVKGCEKYNIPYGVYLYSYANHVGNDDTSSTAEANHIIRLLNSLKSLGYTPTLGTKVFYDIEDEKWQGSYSKAVITNVATDFCTKIENAGYKCGIYASNSWLTNHMNAVELASKYDIWLAEWGQNNKNFSWALVNDPTYKLTPYKFWQFASTGSMDGISSSGLDLDVGYDIFD